MRNILSLFSVCLSLGMAAQQPVPVSGAQSKSVLISNVKIHVGNGKVYDQGLIGFRNGKIDLVGDARVVKLKSGVYDTTITMNGEEMYPAFFAPNSTIGLTEVEAVRATNDFQETGKYNAHIRAVIAFNSDSKVTPTVKANGVMYAQITPRGGVVSGTSSILSLDAWNWEDALRMEDEGLHINYPRSMKRNGWWAEPQNPSANDNWETQLNELKQFFMDARSYCTQLTKPETNLRFEAMRPVLNGKRRVYVHCNTAKEILSAIAFFQEQGISKMVIVGGREAWKVSETLKRNKIPVMINRLHDLPEHEHDDVNLPYKLPALLQKDSVLFCLQNEGDMEAMNARNLPFLAGTAVAYGLDYEQAVASLSLNAAKIMGLDSLYGSLETGKMASFFISKGDALDMRTNEVIMAFMEGRLLSLSTEQKALYEKFRKKQGLAEPK